MHMHKNIAFPNTWKVFWCQNRNLATTVYLPDKLSPESVRFSWKLCMHMTVTSGLIELLFFILFVLFFILYSGSVVCAQYRSLEVALKFFLNPSNVCEPRWNAIILKCPASSFVTCLNNGKWKWWNLWKLFQLSVKLRRHQHYFSSSLRVRSTTKWKLQNYRLQVALLFNNHVSPICFS